MDPKKNNVCDLLHNRIKKTHKKSYFIFFEKNSQTFFDVFKDKPLHKGESIVVLQIVYISDKLFMAEVVHSPDY